MEKDLTPQQNTCAARIFLNTFGLILGNTSDIDESSKIKIFDKNTNEVGQLYFDNDKVIMSANYNNSVLDASFEIAKMIGFVDIECGNALFGKWNSKIIFELKKENNIKLSGEFLLSSSVDSEYGISCFCHPLINCNIADKGNITLKILRNSKVFGYKATFLDYNETIDIMPYDDCNGFIKHVITKGEYDKQRYKHEYRKYVGVFSAGKGNEDKLHLFLSETEWDNQISYRNELIPKKGDDNSEELVIQKGALMEFLDPDMFDKIIKLREVLLIGDISLLDNLISVCYDSYTDDQLNALLGLNRRKPNYQDGNDNLTNSYFGIKKNNCFFTAEEQKRLLKK